VLQINSIQNWKEYELFWREAKTLQSLDIPGVATFYEAIENLDEDQPHAYLVQQLIHGKTLAETIKSGVRFSIQNVFSLAIQVIDILEKLHHHDPPIIHRDIKPSNILLEPNGKDYKVYLTDFGAVYNPLLQRCGSTIAGTYGYMSPEQLMGSVSPASDIYALGVMLPELLSGISPADMDVTEFRLNIEKPLESVPAPVVSLIRRMTTPNASDRLCDYALLRQSFGAFAQNNYTPNALVESHQQSPKAYNRQLKKVERIGQKGNLDLWLQLPEQTPREIPKVYKKLNSPYRPLYGLHEAYAALTFFLNPMNIFFNFTRFIEILFYIICLIFLFIVFGCSIFLIYLICVTFDDLYRHLTMGYSFGSDLFNLIIFILILLGFVFEFLFPGKEFWDFRRELRNIHNTELLNVPKLKHLLQNGRKSLATVRDVQYRAKSEKQYPEFVLQYAFNPPDDSEPGDLTHEVVVPYDPALKPGDVLPILYTISEDNNEVMSMPFPFPTKALPELSSCYCRTLRGVIQTS
jgi:serine/threonine protein kinase